MSVRRLDRCDVDVSHLGLSTVYALGATSQVAYGFLCDDVFVGQGRLRSGLAAYALFASEAECLVGMRGRRCSEMLTFVMRDDGSVLLVSGPRLPLFAGEMPFSKDVPFRSWSPSCVNAAIGAAVRDFRATRHQCVAFAATVMRNLVCRRPVSFAAHADAIGVLGMPSHIAVLGNDMWLNSHQPLFSEDMVALDADRVLGMVDAGYALMLPLEVGARLPRAGGEVEVLSEPHAVVTCRLDDDALCVIDSHGALRICDEDVKGLCGCLDGLGGAAWSFGCIVLGVREDGNMVSPQEFADEVARFDRMRFFDASTGEVSYVGSFDDVSRVAGSPEVTLDVLASDFRTSAMGFFAEAYAALSQDKVYARIDNHDMLRDVDVVRADRQAEKLDLSPIGGSFSRDSREDEHFGFSFL